jgi:hypothetical protein
VILSITKPLPQEMQEKILQLYQSKGFISFCNSNNYKGATLNGNEEK